MYKIQVATILCCAASILVWSYIKSTSYKNTASHLLGINIKNVESKVHDTFFLSDHSEIDVTKTVSTQVSVINSHFYISGKGAYSLKKLQIFNKHGKKLFNCSNIPNDGLAVNGIADAENADINSDILYYSINTEDSHHHPDELCGVLFVK